MLSIGGNCLTFTREKLRDAQRYATQSEQSEDGNNRPFSAYGVSQSQPPSHPPDAAAGLPIGEIPKQIARIVK